MQQGGVQAALFDITFNTIHRRDCAGRHFRKVDSRMQFLGVALKNSFHLDWIESGVRSFNLERSFERLETIAQVDHGVRIATVLAQEIGEIPAYQDETGGGAPVLAEGLGIFRL